MGSIRVFDVRNVEGLVPHADSWDSLALASPEQLPMVSHAWVASFLEHNLSDGEFWRCIIVYVDDELIGVLPVVRIQRRIPGNRLHGTFGVHTRSAYALLRVGEERQALGAMLESLEDLEPHYLWLRLCGVPSGSPILAIHDQVAARIVTMDASRWRGSGSGSVLAVRSSFDDFERGLPVNFRRNLRKARNRCERDHQVSYQFFRGPQAGSQDLLHRFLDLESAGWKGDAGTAIKRSRRLTDFYTALTRRLSDRGWLEWHFLELDGRPVAGHLAIRFGGSICLFKIAFDEVHARLGPGSLLFREMVRRAFADEKVNEVNCLTDMSWHDNWNMSKIHYSDLVISPRRALPALAAVIEVRLPAALVRRRRDTPWLDQAAQKVKAVRRGTSAQV